MSKGRRAATICAVVVATCPFSSARGQDEPLPDRFKIEIGAFFVEKIDTVAELTRTAGFVQVGGVVDFNQDLALKDAVNVPRLDGYYRFTKRSAIDFSYWKIDRDATTYLGRDIDFGEISVPIGEQVSSFFDTETIRASYGYSFFNSPKAELALSVGLHVTSFDLGITCDSCSSPTRESATVTAPLPVAGIAFRYQISRRWKLAGYTQHFAIQVDGYDGSLVDSRINFSHHTFKNVGFGFGWNRIFTDLDLDVSDYLGAIKNNLQGFQAFVVVFSGKPKYANP